MKKILLLSNLLLIAGCSSLPSGTHIAEPKIKTNLVITERVVSNKKESEQSSGDALFGVYNTKQKRWRHPLQYKQVHKFKHGNLHPLRFGQVDAYALQKQDQTWELATHIGKIPIQQKLKSFDCLGKNICLGRDAEGVEYRYKVDDKFRLISQGNFDWEKTKEGFYRTAGKEEGLYFYRFGDAFYTPRKEHIGTHLSYDLGRGNRKSFHYYPVIIDKFHVNGQALLGLGNGKYAEPICKNISLHLFAEQAGDGKAKRANLICEHIDGSYVSFSKFRRGGMRFLESGGVDQWAKGNSRAAVIAESEEFWDKAIQADLANVKKDIAKDKEFKAYVAAKNARMRGYGEELYNKGVRTRYNTIRGWCDSKGLNRFDCGDAYKAAENYAFWKKNQYKSAVKKRNTSYNNVRNGYGSTSGFNSSAAAYARKQDMKKFQQTMDYIKGTSTYNPNASYRQNR